jgi:endonuclease-3
MCYLKAWWDSPLRQRRVAVIAEMSSVLDGTFGGAARDRKRVRPDGLDALMRTILSQNTNDENRDRAYDRMRARFPDWSDVIAADAEHLKEAIRVAGLANTKAPNMQAFLRWLKRERGNLNLDFLRDLSNQAAVALLTEHRGIGVKTAYILLAFAFDRDLCAVDTHVYRILRRVGIVSERCSREKAHLELAPLIPGGQARAFHMNSVDFGKTVCTARNPSCGVCPISHLCRYYHETQGG